MKADTTNAVEDIYGNNLGSAGEPELLSSGDLLATIGERGLAAASQSVRRFVESTAARLKAERKRLLGN